MHASISNMNVEALVEAALTPTINFLHVCVRRHGTRRCVFAGLTCYSREGKTMKDVLISLPEPANRFSLTLRVFY